MERKQFAQLPCSLARPLDAIGDWWTPLILRECLYGVHRFDELQWWLGIGRNILTRRLALLIAHGLLERRPYQDKPPRFDYHLSNKGYEAATALLAIIPFGERWYFSAESAPIHLYHRRTGQRVQPQLVDANTGEALDARDLYAGPGPGFPHNEAIQRRRFVEYFAKQSKDHKQGAK